MAKKPKAQRTEPQDAGGGFLPAPLVVKEGAQETEEKPKNGDTAKAERENDK